MNRPRTWQQCDSKTLQSCLKYQKPSARSLLGPGQSEWQFPSPGTRLWSCWDTCIITFLADLCHLIGFIICSTPEKLWSSFPNFIYHKADREQSHLYVSFTASGLWSKADLRTYSHPSSPLAQPRSLLDEYASKRELGKGPVLAWERIFKAKSTLRLRFGFYWFLVSQLPLMLLKSADFQMYPQLASYSKRCSIAEVTAHLYSPP